MSSRMIGSGGAATGGGLPVAPATPPARHTVVRSSVPSAGVSGAGAA